MDGRPLRVRCGTAEPDRVADFVDQLSSCAGLSKSQAYWLRLAADEITTNIAHHGYRDAGGVLDLTAWCDGRRVCLQIEDDAPAFDPRGYDPTIRHSKPAHEREEGGWGLMLAIGKVDEFGYDLVAGRNRNTLVMLREETR